jgi:hypothetical protein
MRNGIYPQSFSNRYPNLDILFSPMHVQLYTTHIKDYNYKIAFAADNNLRVSITLSEYQKVIANLCDSHFIR